MSGAVQPALHRGGWQPGSDNNVVYDHPLTLETKRIAYENFHEHLNWQLASRQDFQLTIKDRSIQGTEHIRRKLVSLPGFSHKQVKFGL